MQGFELSAALRRLGMSKAELARRCEVRGATVSAWAASDRIPGAVSRYIELLEACANLASFTGFTLRIPKKRA